MSDTSASRHWYDLHNLPLAAPKEHGADDGYAWSDIYTPKDSSDTARESDTPALARHGDSLHLREVTLSPRASEVLLARIRGANAAHVGEVLSLLLEHYAHVVELTDSETAFTQQEAALIARSFDHIIRQPGGVGDVGGLAMNVYMELELDHQSDNTGSMPPENEWPQWERDLLARLRTMSMPTEAAVLDRLLLAAHPSMRHLDGTARLRAVGLVAPA